MMLTETIHIVKDKVTLFHQKAVSFSEITVKKTLSTLSSDGHNERKRQKRDWF